MKSSSQLVVTLGLRQPLVDPDLEPFQIASAPSIDDALRLLAEGNVAALLLGPSVALPQVLDTFASRTSEPPAGKQTPIILLDAGAEAEALQKYVDAGQLFYIARGEVTSRQLLSLIARAAEHSASMTNPIHDPLAGDAASASTMLDLCSRLPMQADLASAGRLLIETGRDVLRAKLVQCFIYDPEAETLTPADASESETWSYSAASGLAAYVVRTGERVSVERVGQDPRYDSDIDAPPEMTNARFLAEPIPAPNGLPAGVITAVRGGEDLPFSSEDERSIKLLTECSAPTFNQILLQHRVQQLLTKRASGSEANAGIFRQEALDYHIRNWDQQGDVLKVLPMWLRRSFWFVVVTFSASLLGLAFLLPGLRNIFGK